LYSSGLKTFFPEILNNCSSSDQVRTATKVLKNQ
jgi:hypothetical protein